MCECKHGIANVIFVAVTLGVFQKEIATSSLFCQAFLYGRAFPILLPAFSDCSHLAVTKTFAENLDRGRDGNQVGVGTEESPDSLLAQPCLTYIHVPIST